MAASRAFRERILLARCRDMVEERKNDRCIEIVYGEDSRFDALGVTNKS